MKLDEWGDLRIATPKTTPTAAPTPTTSPTLTPMTVQQAGPDTNMIVLVGIAIVAIAIAEVFITKRRRAKPGKFIESRIII